MWETERCIASPLLWNIIQRGAPRRRHIAYPTLQEDDEIRICFEAEWFEERRAAETHAQLSLHTFYSRYVLRGFINIVLNWCL